MAEKLPNISDYYDSSTSSLDANSFYNAWSDIFNSSDYPDGYDFSFLLDYPGSNISGVTGSKMYQMAVSGNSINFDIVGRSIVTDFKYSLSGDNPTFTDNFNLFLGSFNPTSNDEFSLGIDSIDTSVYFMGFVIILTGLISIWAIKKVIGLYK